MVAVVVEAVAVVVVAVVAVVMAMAAAMGATVYRPLVNIINGLDENYECGRFVLFCAWHVHIM